MRIVRAREAVTGAIVGGIGVTHVVASAAMDDPSFLTSLIDQGGGYALAIFAIWIMSRQHSSAEAFKQETIARQSEDMTRMVSALERVSSTMATLNTRLDQLDDRMRSQK